MDYFNKKDCNKLNYLDVIKEQWTIMTKKYFKLLEREKRGEYTNSKVVENTEKTSCPSG